MADLVRVIPTFSPRDYQDLALAHNTRRSYRTCVRNFSAWCREQGFDPVPTSPYAVAGFLGAYAGIFKVTYLELHLRAIKQLHRLAGFGFDSGDPNIRLTLQGIRRKHGAPPRQSAALGTREVLAMAKACPPGLAGDRDRALILIGFAGALRRSELCGIDLEHCSFGPDALRILLPHSKADAGAEGIEVVIPKGRKKETCPVAALQRWIEVSATQFGPVFRKVYAARQNHIGWGRLSGNAVLLIVQRAAARAGITVPDHQCLSPHGLRAGFITEAYRAGARGEDIMAHVRHKEWDTTRRYIRRSGKLDDNPARLVGL